jgi:hypothetical protein
MDQANQSHLGPDRFARGLAVIAGGSITETIAPVIGMAAVVFESENAEMIGEDAIINCVWKAWHGVAPHILMYDARHRSGASEMSKIARSAASKN